MFTPTRSSLSIYRERLPNHGIEVVVPDPEDREAVDTIILEELTYGIVRDGSRKRYLEVIDELVAMGAEGVVLGCTEIGLLVEQADRPDVPLFNTTALHVERAIEYSLQKRELSDAERPGGDGKATE